MKSLWLGLYLDGENYPGVWIRLTDYQVQALNGCLAIDEGPSVDAVWHVLNRLGETVKRHRTVTMVELATEPCDGA